MSSTKTELDPRLPLPAIIRRPRSLSARLTGLYVGSTALLLFFTAGYLYWGLADGLGHKDDALVTGKFNVLSLLVREHHDKEEALISEIEHEAAENQLLKYYLRVLDARERVLIETPGMAGFLPVTVFPPPSAIDRGPPAIVARQIGSDKNYRLLSAEVAAGPDGRDRRILHIALDVGHNADLLADYRWKLLFVLGAGILFAAVAGVLVTRRGLRPLRTMAGATRRITAQQLSDRLRAEDWPAELRELASAFDAMMDRLEEAFGRLTEFSADLAHALRNPINNLRGEAEVALGQTRTAAEYQRVLASSLEEFDRLARMIDGLLFIARTDDPAAKIERNAFAARAELAAVQEFYEALAADKSIAVTCEGDARLAGDPMLFRRAVSNLLANALKHTPAGGQVRLVARDLADGSAEIVVSDTGVGIPAEHLPHVFERFYQVNKSRDQTTPGAGLGLAIVRSIMRLHQGSVRIECPPGHGTVTTLHFPAA